MPFHIVLVEPEIPQNTGNIARTCACTGSSLHLVKPMGFAVDDRKLKRAGLDYWHELDITYYENLGEFLERHGNDELFFFTTKGGRRYSDISYPDGCYLVFGKETAGLPERLLRAHYRAERGAPISRPTCPYDATFPRGMRRTTSNTLLEKFPMRETLRSLNLSNSVAIAVYEALRQHDFPNLAAAGAFAGKGTDA